MTYSAPSTFKYQIVYNDSYINYKLEFKILFEDTTWMIGSNAIFVLGSQDSYNIIVYPYFKSTNGRYGYIRDVYSNELKNYRDLVIYTPPSYNENIMKIYRNVLIMHDGQNLFNDSTSFAGRSWRCKETLDYMINVGEMEEIIIVGVDNTNGRIDEYTYSRDSSIGGGGKADMYLDFLESTVIPEIVANYRIAKNAKFGILGSSLGGLLSCYAGYTRSKIYNKAGCMSSSFWWNNKDFSKVILTKNPKPNNIYYLDSGNQGQTKDGMVDTISVRDQMKSLGFVLGKDLFYYLDNGGDHNEFSWGNRFWVPMASLYPPSSLDPQ